MQVFRISRFILTFSYILEEYNLLGNGKIKENEVQYIIHIKHIYYII